MNKKIEYINKINERFINASNHGHNGNNWWYPKANVIAYNVKMYRFADVESLRKVLSKRQNEYYSDKGLSELLWQDIYDNATMLSDDIDTEFHVKNGYAGRSNGWLEVEYRNELQEVDENTSKKEIESYYETAKELEALEAKVASYIAERHASYNKYIDTPQHYKDMADALLDDHSIADIYKGKIKSLADKLQ